MKKYYSPLTMLRIDGIQGNLELVDPSNNHFTNINPDLYCDLASAQQLTLNLKNSIQKDLERDTTVTNECLHWEDRGWRKSLDFYIASKNPTFTPQIDANNKIANINCSNHNMLKVVDFKKIKYKVNQGILPSLIARRTKRVFKKQTLDNEVFNIGLLNVRQLLFSDNLDGFNIYYIIYDVENIDSGVYFLDAEHWSLKKLFLGDFSNEMSNNLQGLRAPNMAFFTCIFVADFELLLKRMPYASGLRATYIEVGRLAQKILIGYGQYGFGCLPTPALSDRNVAKLLQLEETCFSPLYSLTFGYPVK